MEQEGARGSEIQIAAQPVGTAVPGVRFGVGCRSQWRTLRGKRGREGRSEEDGSETEGRGDERKESGSFGSVDGTWLKRLPGPLGCDIGALSIPSFRSPVPTSRIDDHLVDFLLINSHVCIGGAVSVDLQFR